ncbi:hypothetical protein KSP40_PGU021033 [Platanthera guangdongensis]|uniref:Uncharacterized protein n=1 Tax=Platanthera guangdongensis TaxID=2320717 RepID=A0ABR2M3A1_9ASPA
MPLLFFITGERHRPWAIFPVASTGSSAKHQPIDGLAGEIGTGKIDSQTISSAADITSEVDTALSSAAAAAVTSEAAVTDRRKSEMILGSQQEKGTRALDRSSEGWTARTSGGWTAYGSGRQLKEESFPGKAMGFSTVHLWFAQLHQNFSLVLFGDGVDLSECLKMLLEMEKPLVHRTVLRISKSWGIDERCN